LLCSFPNVVCMNTSWTRTQNESEYWNKNHFKERVNNKLNSQLISIIKKNNNKQVRQNIKNPSSSSTSNLLSTNKNSFCPTTTKSKKMKKTKKHTDK
jgi:hypothetical protein